MKRKARKTAVNSMETFKVKASDVFQKIDERFNRQEEQNENVRKEMRTEIRALGDKIDAQIHTFDKQLSKLNDNMDAVLRRISDHETRIARLESDKQQDVSTKKAWEKVADVLWTAAKGMFYVMMALGAAYGIKPMMKIFNLLQQ